MNLCEHANIIAVKGDPQRIYCGQCQDCGGISKLFRKVQLDEGVLQRMFRKQGKCTVLFSDKGFCGAAVKKGREVCPEHAYWDKWDV
jgi:hypothetical protein